MRTKTAVLAAAIASALMLTGCGEDKKSASAEPTIGVIQLVEHQALDAANRGFVDEVKGRGLKVRFDQQNAQADQSNMHNIVQRFVSQKYPLIFAIATPAAQTAANATSSIPIVGTAITDFETAKLVKSNEKPGTNVTGSSDMNPVAEQLELLLEIAPSAKRIGTIYNSSEVNSQVQIDILKKLIAKKPGLTLTEVTISNVNDMPQAARSLVGKVDAMYLPTDNMIASAASIIAGVTVPAKIPVIAAEEGAMRGCCLATLGVDYYELGRIAGGMAADILSGKSRPQDMAIEHQKTFRVKINGRIQRETGIVLPESVKARAEFVETK